MTRGRIGAGALTGMLGSWRSEAPAYEALAERIRLLLIDGRLSAQTRLPSQRDLSDQLGLSRTTITAAYGLLCETGYARSVQGSGTTTMLPPTTPEAVRARPHLVNLSVASLPATALMPEAAQRATAMLVDHYGGHGYDPVGLAQLRLAIAERYTARGLDTRPEQIVVTTGAQSAIALLARALVSRGDRAYAESPSYPHAFDALHAAGARVVTSPVTVEHGWDVDALVTTMARTMPAMAYVMPDFHNPTARSMTTDDRDALLSAAARIDAVVVADETLAEIDIDRPEQHPPLATHAGRHGARVVHIGSASKLLWGGLRIGWIRADHDVLSRVTGLRPAHDLGTPVWDQLVAATLIPRSDEIVEERRGQLRERRDALYAGASRSLPDWRPPPTLHGGLTAWMRLPLPASSALTLAARTAGLHVTAGPRFGTDGAYERYLRLPLSAEPVDLTRAIELLGDIWPQVAASPASGGPAVADRVV